MKFQSKKFKEIDTNGDKSQDNVLSFILDLLSLLSLKRYKKSYMCKHWYTFQETWQEDMSALF